MALLKRKYPKFFATFIEASEVGAQSGQFRTHWLTIFINFQEKKELGKQAICLSYRGIYHSMIVALNKLP